MKTFVLFVIVIVVKTIASPAAGQSSNRMSLSLQQIYNACEPFLTPHQLEEYSNCSDDKKMEWIRINCIGVDRYAEQYGTGRLSPTEKKWLNNCAPYLTPSEKEAIQNAPSAVRRHWLGRHCLTPLKLPGKPDLTAEEKSLLMTLPLPLMRHSFLMAGFDQLLAPIIACRTRITPAQFEAFFKLPTVGPKRSEWLNAHCRRSAASTAAAAENMPKSEVLPADNPSTTRRSASPESAPASKKRSASIHATAEKPPELTEKRGMPRRVTPLQKRKILLWRIMAHIAAWNGLTNIGFGLGLGFATDWDAEQLQLSITSLSVGGALVIYAGVAAAKYAKLKRRAFYGFVLPSSRFSGAVGGVGVVF